MDSIAQIKARERNLQIFMFRGMAKRVAFITRDLFKMGLTQDEVKTVVKFNTLMNKKINELDEIKAKKKQQKRKYKRRIGKQLKFNFETKD